MSKVTSYESLAELQREGQSDSPNRTHHSTPTRRERYGLARSSRAPKSSSGSDALQSRQHPDYAAFAYTGLDEALRVSGIRAIRTTKACPDIVLPRRVPLNNLVERPHLLQSSPLRQK